MDTLNVVALTVSLTLLMGYHIYFFYALIYTPNNVVAGWTRKVRKSWVLQTLDKRAGDILAVQTLRNWILGATYLATASMFIAFGLLSFIAQAARISLVFGERCDR